MNTILQIGTEIEADLRTPSDQRTQVPVKTTGDLLARSQGKLPRAISMLKTTCGLLGTYLNLPGDQIPIDTLDARRKGFRAFLASRPYTENSIRSFVYQLRVLLKTARRLGWKPDANAPERWRPLLTVASEKKVMDIVRYFSRVAKTPGDVTIEDVELWCKEMTTGGMLFTTVAAKRNAFWRLLQDTGWTTLNPLTVLHQTKYGVPLDQLDPGLRQEAEVLLKWKQAEYAVDRPKWGKIRAVSANNLRLTICQLAGFVINVCGIQPTSMSDLVQKKLVQKFVEWSINERGKKGHTIQSRLGMLDAVMSHHPAYASQDFSWLKTLIDSVSLEDDSERKRRKAEKYVDYDVLETIPDKIRSARETYNKRKKKDPKRAARLAMEELIFRWLLVLPWRQRNVRECRVGGANPNLFKAAIPAFSDLDIPTWVIEEEEQNPHAEFWQIRLSPKETKTGIAIHTLLPRQLIAPLEEYLVEHRPLLLAEKCSNHLFVNRIGRPMRADFVEKIIGRWTLQTCGVRTTPHLFRDAVAFKWLKTHPKDYLTLAKMLWHKRVETTVGIYGARYNESSGVSAMEEWLDQREAQVKAG